MPMDRKFFAVFPLLATMLSPPLSDARQEAQGPAGAEAPQPGPTQQERLLKTANDYPDLTDSECIENAISGRLGDGVVIPERKSSREPKRTCWELDRAILLPSDTTVILLDCRVKLSDRCRDNFFRSANCGIGFAETEPLSNMLYLEP